MKIVIKTTVFLAIVFTLPVYCKKNVESPSPPPPPPPPIASKYKPIRVKFIEYGTGTILQGVEVKSYKCEESGKIACNRSKLLNSWTSDSNGVIEISASQQKDTIFSFTIIKPGYYPMDDPNKMANDIAGIADTFISLPTYDSAVVEIFPNAWIRLQIKNSVPYKNKETVRSTIEAIKSIAKIIDLEPFLPWNQPANNLDTMILYKTYGNVNNRIIFELNDSSLNFIKIAYRETKFVPKSDTLNWVISY